MLKGGEKIMTTIVNNPPSSNDSNGTMGMFIGVITLMIAGYLFFIYGLPAIKNMQYGNPQINIPNKIDVNLQQKK
jgi:hypothetical protein